MPPFHACPNCFHPLHGETICGNCSYALDAIKIPPGALPPLTLLNNRYLIGRTLGKGGFGITYIAKDIKTNRICAVKEYMPTEYAGREGGTQLVHPFPDQKARYVFEHGKEKYMEEAKTLLRLINDPIVVDIWDYFTQNNTAYLVMEFLDGNDLRRQARLSGGVLDPEFAKQIFVTAASSLMEIHRMNILHRDLSPENIFVTNSGKIKLIDFGAARNYVRAQNKGMSILLKPGFAPPEQYSTQGVQGPWSDVYALCATFYNVVSGKPLVDALFRYRGEHQPSLLEMGCPVTKQTSDVIERGMELDYKRRYQNFKQLLDDIDIQSVVSVHRQTSETKQPPTTGNHTNRGEQPRNLTPIVTILLAGQKPQRCPLRNNDIVKIGRSRQSSNVVLDHDTNISRVHCYIRFDANRKIFLLSDVSVNGTYFEDGRRLDKNREYPISPGTKFYLASPENLLAVSLDQT